MTKERIARIKSIFEEHGPIARATLLRANNICSKDIAQLVSSGLVQKIRTGYYAWGDSAENLNETELAASIIPNGVVCLFSAAAVYEMSTVNPTSIDIAIPVGTTPILLSYPPVSLHKIAKNIYPIGITQMIPRNCNAKIYDRERTVCDFFRMRLQIGLDVAMEVLKNYMNGTKNIQRLYEYAEKMRIKNVIAPYVEALI